MAVQSIKEILAMFVSVNCYDGIYCNGGIMMITLIADHEFSFI